VGTAAALLLWPEAPIGRTLFAVTKFWTALLPVVWLLWIDRQSVRWSPARKGGFGVATLSGILIAALILATYHFALRHGFIQPNLIAEQASRTGLDQIQVYVMGAVYWITLNSLMEEYVWRWFVFRKFEQLMKAPLAVLATALGFTAHHVVALAAQFDWKITLLGSLGVFLGGLTWSGIYLRYRSVWPCYLSHAIVDAPIFWIGYDLIFRRAA
jgi:membrane protease YdiL (CAAX protease family)